LLTELDRLRPAEIILPSEAASLQALLKPSFPIMNPYDDWVFAMETAQFTVRDHFKVASLDGFGLRVRTAAIGAAGVPGLVGSRRVSRASFAKLMWRTR